MHKPAKPYENFPLFAADNGQWRKDVRTGGKVKQFYFGGWVDDPRGERAVKEWLKREPGIRAGIDHLREDVVGPALTVAALFRRVLERKQVAYQRQELVALTFRGYVDELNRFGDWIGPDAQVSALVPEHFARYRELMETERKLGPDRLATSIRKIKAAFRFALNHGWLDKLPTFGEGFKPPATDPDAKSVAASRRGEQWKPKALWTGAEIDWVLANTKHKLIRAAVLLAANTGIGMADIARLQWGNLIHGRKMEMRRGKTGVARECYLWKRTRDALAELSTMPQVIKARAATGDGSLVFLTNRGSPVVHMNDKMDGDRIKDVTVTNALYTTFLCLVQKGRAAGVLTDRHTFYGLRHSAYTYAEEVGDLNALHRMVGHKLAGQGGVYHHGPIRLPRLKKLALRIKRRLWPKVKAPKVPVLVG